VTPAQASFGNSIPKNQFQTTENRKGGTMEVMTISNSRYGGSTVVVSGYAMNHNNQIVLLDIAPMHPKLVGAIWAELVSGTPRSLWLTDPGNGRDCSVRGMGSAYTRLLVDVSQLSLPNAANARARFLRCVYPKALKATFKRDHEKFYILEWPGMSAGRTLAAMVERDTPYPMLMDWGEALLEYGIAQGTVRTLEHGGTSPLGYEVDRPEGGWAAFIASAVRDGVVTIR
jgi:hypothetical protein